MASVRAMKTNSMSDESDTCPHCNAAHDPDTRVTGSVQVSISDEWDVDCRECIVAWKCGSWRDDHNEIVQSDKCRIAELRSALQAMYDCRWAADGMNATSVANAKARKILEPGT